MRFREKLIIGIFSTLTILTALSIVPYESLPLLLAFNIINLTPAIEMCRNILWYASEIIGTLWLVNLFIGVIIYCRKKSKKVSSSI